MCVRVCMGVFMGVFAGMRACKVGSAGPCLLGGSDDDEADVAVDVADELLLLPLTVVWTFWEV